MFCDYIRFFVSLRCFDSFLRSVFISCDNIFQTSGKMLRASFVFLFSGIYTKFALNIAKIIEDLHLASIFHDDVIDNNLERRGEDSLNSRYGDKISILLGDFILIKSISDFLHLSQIDSVILRVFIRECKSTSYGALLEQYLNKSRIIDLSRYIRMISLKTSPFFKLSCFLGKYIATHNFQDAKKSAIWGICFGIIFQVQNDLDSYKNDLYCQSEDYLQKNITFPIIILVKYFHYDFNRFFSITSQEEFNFIKKLIQSSKFKKITKKVLQKYRKYLNDNTQYFYKKIDNIPKI